MNSQTQKKFLIHKEPYRLFFPLGVLMLLWGSLIWIPQIFNSTAYPVLAHRYLMLNGFCASFIAGFLMTAVPKFSQTKTASIWEIYTFLGINLFGLICAYMDLEALMYLSSGACCLSILFFLIRRIATKKVNPPYSFIFIFVGLIFWAISAFMSAYHPIDLYKNWHAEAAIMAIILGVGSRLIPGILGHTEIVQTQRAMYETDRSFLKTIPTLFFLIILAFIASYAFPEIWGNWLRFIVVASVGFIYWSLYKFPKDKSALTWNIWGACWLILGSFFLKAIWPDGGIHAGHSFFFGGIVLLCFLIATRVLQSHGPGDKRLENLKILYLVSGLVILAGATRVSAILMPESYLHHLGYSSFTLVCATLIWSYRYLRFAGTNR